MELSSAPSAIDYRRVFSWMGTLPFNARQHAMHAERDIVFAIPFVRPVVKLLTHMCLCHQAV